MEALLPLLRELDYPLSSAEPPTLVGGCKIGLVIVPTGSINAGARPGTRSPCVYFGLFLTEGAVTKLPPPQLRALLAHELAHVHLGHFRARRERAEAGGVENWWLLRQAHDRAEESAADAFAARLLLRLEHDQPGSCMALVFVLEMLAERPASAEWLADHPAPAQRAERVEAICNGRGGKA